MARTLFSSRPRTMSLLILAGLAAAGGLATRLVADPPQVHPVRDIPLRRNVPELETLLTLAPLPVDDRDDAEARLLKERYNSALTSVRIHYNQYALSLDAYEDLLFVGRRLAAATRELPLAAAERTQMLDSYLRYVRGLERSIARFGRLDPDSVADLEDLRYDRMSLELDLLQEHRGSPEQPRP